MVLPFLAAGITGALHKGLDMQNEEAKRRAEADKNEEWYEKQKWLIDYRHTAENANKSASDADKTGSIFGIKFRTSNTALQNSTSLVTTLRGVDPSAINSFIEGSDQDGVNRDLGSLETAYRTIYNDRSTRAGQMGQRGPAARPNMEGFDFLRKINNNKINEILNRVSGERREPPPPINFSKMGFNKSTLPANVKKATQHLHDWKHKGKDAHIRIDTDLINYLNTDIKYITPGGEPKTAKIADYYLQSRDSNLQYALGRVIRNRVNKRADDVKRKDGNSPITVRQEEDRMLRDQFYRWNQGFTPAIALSAEPPNPYGVAKHPIQQAQAEYKSGKDVAARNKLVASHRQTVDTYNEVTGMLFKLDDFLVNGARAGFVGWGRQVIAGLDSQIDALQETARGESEDPFYKKDFLESYKKAKSYWENIKDKGTVDKQMQALGQLVAFSLARMVQKNDPKISNDDVKNVKNMLGLDDIFANADAAKGTISLLINRMKQEMYGLEGYRNEIHTLRDYRAAEKWRLLWTSGELYGLKGERRMTAQQKLKAKTTKQGNIIKSKSSEAIFGANWSGRMTSKAWTRELFKLDYKLMEKIDDNKKVFEAHQKNAGNRQPQAKTLPYLTKIEDAEFDRDATSGIRKALDVDGKVTPLEQLNYSVAKIPVFRKGDPEDTVHKHYYALFKNDGGKIEVLAFSKKRSALIASGKYAMGGQISAFRQKMNSLRGVA